MKTETRKSRLPIRFRTVGEIPARYADLCGLLLPRVIHSAAEARSAAEIMEALAGFPLSQDQEDYLEALAHFLDEYDRGHAEPLPQASARAVLACLLEMQGQSGADLSRILGGSRNLGSMILRGDRPLTLRHVRRLAGHFGVAAGVFVD